MKYILFLLGFLYFSAFSIAQKYNFRNYSVSEGLTQSEIYAICEDMRGNLWFGSMGGGIIKYDGYSFSSYREEDGLIDNFVYSIYEDSKGNLWIGTEKGVCVYDGQRFTSLGDSTALVKATVRSIIEDKDSTLWFGTSKNGIFQYHNGAMHHFLPDSAHPGLTIYCLCEGKDSAIWIGTDSGVCRHTRKKSHWFTKKDGLPANVIRTICCDNRDQIWLGTFGGGIVCYDSNRFKSYTVYDGLANNTVYTSLKDSQGNLWFGTAHGATKYNGHIFNTYRKNSGLASNIVVYMAEDSSGDIWLGTAGGGISRFDSERFVHFPENDKMGRWIYSILQAPNGSMLLGSSKGGLTVYDSTGYSLLNGANGFTNSMVMSIHYTSDSTLWCGTLDDGAYKFKRHGFQHFSIDNKLHSNNITSITSDTSGCVWFASLDSGICAYNEKTDSFLFFNTTKGLASNNIYTVVADHGGNIWAGTVNEGLIKITLLDPDSFLVKTEHFTVESGLSNNTVKSIAIDSTNKIFIGTSGGGINIYNNGVLKVLDKKDGLLSTNIYLLVFDLDNNLWAGTESGVDRIVLNTGLDVAQYNHYGQGEGFTGIEVYRNSATLDKNGNLWFGTVNGATRYSPGKDKATPAPPKIHITGIRLFYERIENTRFIDSITPWYPVPFNLSLPYKQNSLTFEFRGIYQRNPSSVRYKWILEGTDDIWSPALDLQEVTYSNLAPGKYIFKVKSCNENGIWNKKPAVFSFEILIPLWQQWWFISSAVFLFVAIIGGIIFIRLKRIKQKNKIAREKLEMEKNIIELEQEAARLQMNPHFIFNSLNSIQGFIATNEAFQAKRYLAKFARLMRLILENAREEFIPVENEVEILENYLELERLSTNNKFDFDIRISKSIQADFIEIPPMLIQPFVENAIIHGIKKKDGKGHISVEFSSAENIVICQITDDGIGRQKADTLNKQLTSKHKSTGISVTQKRLDQFKIQGKTDAGVNIEDLKDSEGNALGTKVVLSIPFSEA
jgi:ligand-binding sensor domain-containing protein